MPTISRKELDKFMKANPDSEATRAIKEQLGETPAPKAKTADDSELTTGSGQIRNTASDLAADQINQLHREVLSGFLGICHKAITIGELLFEQKKALGHGKWLDWIGNELEIGPRQIENYMKIYHEREAVMESMKSQIGDGVKPSIRKMLLAATKKDKQSISDFMEKRQKSGPQPTPKEKRENRKEIKRQNEILAIAKMYIAKEIDDKSLRAFALKWNRDNAVNDEFFVEDVIKQVWQLEDSTQGSSGHHPPRKINIVISVDANIWGNFLYYGGSEVFLAGYVNDFATKYILEQKSLQAAS